MYKNFWHTNENRFNYDQREINRMRGVESPVMLHSGLGNLHDHQRILSNYVCTCGLRMKLTDHSIAAMDTRAIEHFDLRCPGCQSEERVSFLSMRKMLMDAMD